jgi:hypothetical protein
MEVGMLTRYLKAQGMVLLCGGLVGPIFLAVYFALGPMARPYINWMFWVGLFITAVDVLVALALTNMGARSAAKHEQLTSHGLLAPARITGISDTAWFVNDQQMIKVNLHIDIPGQPGLDVQQTMASSPTRMSILNGHTLVALVDPVTRGYEIDWDASALVAGVVPAQFTLDEDHKTYDLTGKAGPLMQILQVLHANKIPLSGAIDIRSIPAVRRQVMDIVRRAGGAAPASAPQVIAPPPAVTVAAPMPLTVSQRLQELETLHATGTITDDEYGVKRREILADL